VIDVLAILAAPVFGLLGVWLGGRLQAKKDDDGSAARTGDI
jgi:hypothetical protein